MSYAPTADRSITSGIVTILLTVFAMALTDAFVKHASSDMTLWQIFVCRSLVALPLLLVLAKGRIRVNSWVWVCVRSTLLVAMYLAIYAAIPVLDLSVIAATLYTSPLFIVLLSAVFRLEAISKVHLVAVLVGFAGVLFVVQPAGAAFTPLSLIPVIAAFFYATAAVLTRAKCAREAPVTLAIALNVALIICGTIASIAVSIVQPAIAASYPFLLGKWTEMTPGSATTLVIMAVLIVAITVGLARAYQSPRPQVIATFDYAYLIFAAFWGFVFFGEVPEASTMGGIFLIMMAGGLVLFFDRRPTNRPLCKARLSLKADE